nr:hypothetical protein Iba_chr11bCG8330 [Ipomoea batatas]
MSPVAGNVKLVVKIFTGSYCLLSEGRHLATSSTTALQLQRQSTSNDGPTASQFTSDGPTATQSTSDDGTTATQSTPDDGPTATQSTPDDGPTPRHAIHPR